MRKANRLLAWILVLANLAAAPLSRASSDPVEVGNSAEASQRAQAATTGKPNKKQAEIDGAADGQRDGAKEASERGPSDGASQGETDGKKEGFTACQREEKLKAHDIGYAKGFATGTGRGQSAAETQARIDADVKARPIGTQEGMDRADKAAQEAAIPMGTQRGNSEADASDAHQRGWDAGMIVGEDDASKRAKEVDYPRGHQDFYREQYARAPKQDDSFSQRPQSGVGVSLKKLGEWLSSSIFDGAGNKSSYSSIKADKRYFKPARVYQSKEENKSYASAYEKSYASGFSASYSGLRKQAYDDARKTSYDASCLTARAADYTLDLDVGVKEGDASGYFQAYHETYDQVLKQAYADDKKTYSDKAARDAYPTFYQKHYELARKASFDTHSKEVYDLGFAQGRQKRYDEINAVYADEAYKNGRTDEAQDFTARPIRLLDAAPAETIQNGLFEPGEALRVNFQVRNFSDSVVAKSNVEVRIQTFDAESTLISEVAQNLSKDLNPNSVTKITEALEFRMNENAVNKAVRFKASLVYKGQTVGEKEIYVTTKWMLNLELAEAPNLHEGIAGTVKVKVKNISQTFTLSNAHISLSTNPELLEVANPDQQIAEIGPQQEVVLEYSVVARTKADKLAYPMNFVATEANGRRIGLLETSPSVPVANDYGLILSSDVKALQKSGLQRLEYKVSNLASTAMLKGMQLNVHVLGKNAANFKILGPSPQYLKPLRKGESLSFVVPVMVGDAGQNGTLEIELQEAGKNVLVERFTF